MTKFFTLCLLHKVYFPILTIWQLNKFFMFLRFHFSWGKLGTSLMGLWAELILVNFTRIFESFNYFREKVMNVRMVQVTFISFTLLSFASALYITNHCELNPNFTCIDMYQQSSIHQSMTNS